jgi:hypothetical protein
MEKLLRKILGHRLIVRPVAIEMLLRMNRGHRNAT